MIDDKIIGAAVITVAAFVAGWYVNGWRWDAKYTDAQNSYATAQQKAADAAQSERDKIAADFAKRDGERNAELQTAIEQNKSLAADVAAGRKQLRVNAVCAKGMPETARTASVGDADTPRLTGAAQQDYYALRDEIAQTGKMLLACQDLLRAEREN